MKHSDFESVARQYYSNCEPDSRYTSFDYCYNHFFGRAVGTTDIESSCMQLGFFLSSWGMYRGSSFILQKSAQYLQSTIEVIMEFSQEYDWIDAPYSDEEITMLIEVYNRIKRVLVPNNIHLTLVTKVMLGVFANVPAFDNNFIKTFSYFDYGCKFKSFNACSLRAINDIYQDNEESIDKLVSEFFTIDFESGQKTKFNYTRAKIIDMYGWQKYFDLVERGLVKKT